MIEIFKDGTKLSSGTAIDLNESTGIDIVATGDGHEGDFTISVEESFLRYTTVSLTNAEIKALAASPKELVAAPGAGKTIELVSAVFKLNAGSEALTETDDNLEIKYTDASGVSVTGAIEATGFIDQTADTYTTAVGKTDTIVAATGAENQALVLDNSGSGEYAGNASDDATMDVAVAYRVHTL